MSDFPEMPPPEVNQAFLRELAVLSRKYRIRLYSPYYGGMHLGVITDKEMKAGYAYRPSGSTCQGEYIVWTTDI